MNIIYSSTMSYCYYIYEYNSPSTIPYCCSIYEYNIFQHHTVLKHFLTKGSSRSFWVSFFFKQPLIVIFYYSLRSNLKWYCLALPWRIPLGSICVRTVSYLNETFVSALPKQKLHTTLVGPALIPLWRQLLYFSSPLQLLGILSLGISAALLL